MGSKKGVVETPLLISKITFIDNLCHSKINELGQKPSKSYRKGKIGDIIRIRNCLAPYLAQTQQRKLFQMFFTNCLGLKDAVVPQSVP